MNSGDGHCCWRVIAQFVIKTGTNYSLCPTFRDLHWFPLIPTNEKKEARCKLYSALKTKQKEKRNWQQKEKKKQYNFVMES